MRARVNFDMQDRMAIDVQVIFHKKEQRNLSAGYEFYCGKTLDNAHSAEADTLATYEILEAQIERFAPDMVVPARITRCMPFGAFAELTPGIEGLIHISALSFTQRVHKPEDVVAPGESVRVMIKSIDRQNRKISLSLKDVAGDPWDAVADQFKVGQIVEGVVAKRAGFGLLVDLAPGITGLLPKSRIGEAGSPGRIENLKPGDTLTVSIDKIDTVQRRISLGPGDRAADKDWEAFRPSGKDSSMGDLAAKLKAALETKNKP